MNLVPGLQPSFCHQIGYEKGKYKIRRETTPKKTQEINQFTTNPEEENQSHIVSTSTSK